MLRRVAEDSPHFVRVDRDGRGPARHYVVHTVAPQFSVELTADAEALDGTGRGVIKRVRVPNSWAGDYTKYAKLLAAAQDFFARSGTGGARR